MHSGRGDLSVRWHLSLEGLFECIWGDAVLSPWIAQGMISVNFPDHKQGLMDLLGSSGRRLGALLQSPCCRLFTEPVILDTLLCQCL